MTAIWSAIDKRLLLVVCHQQRRHPGVGEQRGKPLCGWRPQARVQRGERFVRQHQHRFARQRTASATRCC